MSRQLLILLGLSLVAEIAAAADPPPNVVLIISDDQAWTDFGFMGHKQIRTPHIDKLAAESLTFTRGYVCDSLCRPSLATIVTGLYPHQHGIVGNDPPPPDDLKGKSITSNTSTTTRDWPTFCTKNSVICRISQANGGKGISAAAVSRTA